MTGFQIKIVNICESNRREYQFALDYLFKRSFIEEIDRLLAPEMDYETVKRIMMEGGIHDENILTEILNLNNYGVSFDGKMQIDKIVRKNIPKS